MRRLQMKMARIVSIVAAASLTPLAYALSAQSTKSAASKAIETVVSAVKSLDVDRRGAMAKVADASTLDALCGVSLAEKANLDDQLTWAESASACLSAYQSMLESLLISGDDETKKAVAPTLPLLTAANTSLMSLVVELNAEKDFLGQKWGVGVGYSTGFDDIVGTAAVVDGVVSVTKDLTDQPRVLFEFHNYRWCNAYREDNAPIRTGCGPFAAVASRDDKAVSGVAIGWMYGWKSRDPKEATGFSIGVGVILPERFELPTPWFVARYSIQLSYGRVAGAHSIRGYGDW